MGSSTTRTPPPSSTKRRIGSRRAACSVESTSSGSSTSPTGPGEARQAPTEPVWGEAEVPLPKGDDQINIVCAGELLQYERVVREKEVEAAGEAGAPQYRPKLRSHKCQWGVHPREVEGV